MGEPVSVSVGWALWGKHPGAVREYSVLASSAEPLSQAEFGSVLTHFRPGTPSTEPGSPGTKPNEPDPPGSPPWVTISRVGVADRVYLGISIQDSTAELDGIGRPIASISYYCIPYDDLKGALFSYADLYRQLDRLQLPYQGDRLIQLTVPSLEPDALAGYIEKFGEPALEAAAAMLLSGPVSIVGSEGTTLYDRLDFLDAVAALLPYGYRAGYTGATWSDSGTRHPIRLAFAARPRQDAGVIWWRSAPAVTDDPGGTYLRMLQQIRAQLSGHDDLVTLIKFLERDKQICSFEQPQRAIDSLHDFGLPFIVRNRVREGTAGPHEVRMVFARSRADDLTLTERQELLAELISAADRDERNWQVIDDWWDRVAGGEPLVMLPALARASYRLLWTPAPNPRAYQEHVRRAADHGIIDHLLAKLVVVPDSRPELLGGLQAVVQLVADGLLRRPGASALPQTRLALADNPLVACELLAHLAGAGQGLEPTLVWLQPVLGGFLAPFPAVLGRGPAEVSEQAIGQLADRDAEYVIALLTAARDLRRLNLVLPGFASWLGRNVGPGAPDQVRRYWRARIAALAPAPPDSIAWLDLALLISGNAPMFLLQERNQQGRRAYTASAAGGWAMLCRDLGPAADEVLTNNLASYLRRERWTASAATANAVTDLAEQLTGGGRRSGLRAAVSDALVRTPAAERWTFAREWLPADKKQRSHAREEQRPSPSEGRRSPAELDVPSFVQSGQRLDDNPTLAALCRLGPDATSARVAELCVTAYRTGISLSEVHTALVTSHAIRSGSQAMAVLEDLRRALPTGNSEAEEWLGSFTYWFANGDFGQQAAEDFRSLALQSAVALIDHHARVLHIVTNRSEPRSLGRRETELLTRARKILEDILPDSRSLTSRIPFLGGRHSGDGKDERA
jgi:hypothetical protein